MSERLTTTIKHLKDGVRNMSLTAARHSIESWKTELEAYDGTGSKAIIADLDHLHTELAQDSVNDDKIMKLMAKLAKETQRMAKAAGDKGELVSELGSALESVAAEPAGKK